MKAMLVVAQGSIPPLILAGPAEDAAKAYPRPPSTTAAEVATAAVVVDPAVPRLAM